ncbi:extracellular solute-binding protein [Leptolyngbya sp. 15MV]|nr:extracellular solute-binding protein [Leptolyngbya sp. 15MV]
MHRRALITTTLAAPFALGATARAQANAPLQIISHRVHQTVATGSQGGDITRAFTQASGAPVQWTTFDTGPLWERLQREASLPSTTIDVGFLLNTQVTPRAATLFEPLDDLLRREPIEDIADIFPGLLEGYRVNGALVAIPFRHASSGLHWNEDLFAARGMTAPPTSIEEMAEFAKRATHRAADGTPVTGLVMPGVTYPNVIDIARAWDGEFITPDFRCTADQPPMLNAIRMLRELFQAGAFPRNFAAISPEDVNTWMQQGRGAMALNSMGRNRIYNDPQRSRHPGKIHTIAVPISATLRDRFEVAPAKVEFWGMAIPKASRNKPQAWSLMREMLSKERPRHHPRARNCPARARPARHSRRAGTDSRRQNGRARPSPLDRAGAPKVSGQAARPAASARISAAPSHPAGAGASGTRGRRARVPAGCSRSPSPAARARHRRCGRNSAPRPARRGTSRVAGRAGPRASSAPPRAACPAPDRDAIAAGP